MQSSFLLVNEKDEVLVNLPSGKLSKDGDRKSIQSQTSMSCLLYSMRKLAFFDKPDIKHDEVYKAFRQVKKKLASFNGNYAPLLSALKDLCHDLKINTNLEIASSKAYSTLDKQLDKFKVSILYEALIKHKFFALFNLQESGWHPKDGFNGLKESLKKHGAHVFIGKFGAWCHTGHDKLVKFPKESSSTREVFGFKPKSYAGDSVTWTHAIVVDQVKIVDGREMVFFRDPYDISDPLQKEKIYILSYESFIQRLTNQQSHRYAKNQCQYTDNFGIVSTNPKRLLPSPSGG